jgi:1-aminocyclopropane-1-carboxylate deaminase
MSTDVSLWFAKLKSRSKLERFELPLANNRDVKLFVKRDDLIDPFISGNKLRKLQGNLIAAQKAGIKNLLTFGGAYSNHLLASAAAANALDLSIIGKVRGEELNENSNSMLLKCHQLGMELNFVNRSNFKESKHQSGLSKDQDKFTWHIPEGGANPEGILGCTDIYKEAVAQNNNQHFDAVFLAQGTTTTSMGILASIPTTTQLFVVPVLKGYDSLFEMQALASKAKQNPLTAHLQFNWKQVTVLDTYHHGGYAKTTPELLHFTSAFNSTQQFPIEPTYTAKALFALRDLLQKDDSRLINPTKSTLEPMCILFVHTGGIQAID